MVAFKESQSPLCRKGVYMVAGHAGGIRALVDADLLRNVPGIKSSLAEVGHALLPVLGDKVSVSLMFEPAPVQCSGKDGPCDAPLPGQYPKR